VKRGLGSPNLHPETKRRIQSLGGRASARTATAHKWTSESAQAAGRIGGAAAQARRRLAREAVLTNGIQGAFADALGEATGGKRACWPKQQHHSIGAAEAQLRSLLKRGLAKNARRIHVYECVECARRLGRKTWHVGHPG
jgi:hypothetical protein